MTTQPYRLSVTPQGQVLSPLIFAGLARAEILQLNPVATGSEASEINQLIGRSMESFRGIQNKRFQLGEAPDILEPSLGYKSVRTVTAKLTMIGRIPPRDPADD